MSSGDVLRAGSADPARDVTEVLLVEDDDADAILVSELLDDAGVDVVLRRARTVAEAVDALADAGGAPAVDCVLLDLGLPDAVGLTAVERLRAVAERSPDVPALVVLTGHAGIDQGVQAVAAGADDYLVKGETDADLLGRSLRYALQRRRSAAQQRELYRSAVRASETARLERALLPKPLVADEKVSVMVGYLPGGEGLLGGDFFDTVERPDGTVLSVIGDVAGHGPDEAALGATLRTAWRTLVLTDTPADRILGHLERVLLTERARPEVFVTLCQIAIAPDRASAELYLAGHLPPLLITGPVGDITCELLAPVGRGRALGVPVPGEWAPRHLTLDGPFAIMLYTDGLVEAEMTGTPAAAPQVGDALDGIGRDVVGLAELRGDHAGPLGPMRHRVPRLGQSGLHSLVRADLAEHGFVGVVERVLRRVRALHGGALVDDAALLVVGWTGREAGLRGERSSTLADSAEWAQA
ncbi:fused response regulator/phosphatase [Isoptericola sp. NEAU-Y5]|uniref:Fused response regulator/phosphatase n=1 Tax=Isoptericola luteus TaxID=2879484 RepID=A0ABS7ZF94_9MICO|nr:fused response regulator/phosphatase [Isoptericola sp. NEAU-Y5]MCA5893167.1 fused response regulator/phosphatase [Isoptericola sp. NEAU-Y5]